MSGGAIQITEGQRRRSTEYRVPSTEYGSIDYP